MYRVISTSADACNTPLVDEGTPNDVLNFFKNPEGYFNWFDCFAFFVLLIKNK